MVNLVAAQKPLMNSLMKMTGITPYTVEIEPGTVMSFWEAYGGAVARFRRGRDSDVAVPAALKKLGVENCVVVGFSYGGMVAFKMAEMYPEMIKALVISESILAMTDSISVTTLQEFGFSSSFELLLPTSDKGLKALLSVAAYKKLWFPDPLHKDFLVSKLPTRPLSISMTAIADPVNKKPLHRSPSLISILQPGPSVTCLVKC
ncbi:hypothetical protein PIB30_046549 [Stylosanthes scabra]|uniref:AB hydrolase-1 domain-containing protein n=1 Tax=Stylosanthes scabra TaxID=79078 RepID=A0ABU6UGP9_9FABA|nr:hypothetical protein [Stylosanthes scabra]